MDNIKYIANTTKPNYSYKQTMQNNNVTLEVTPVVNGITLNLAGTTISCNWLRSDGSLVTIAGSAISIINGNVLVKLPQDCTSTPGEVNFELVIVQADEQTSTFPLSLYVNKSVYQGIVKSESYATVVQDINKANASASQTLGQMNQAKEEINDMIESGGVVKASTYKTDKNTLDSTIDKIQDNINSTNANIGTKADVIYVDSKTQGASLAYKESYDTLTLLQAAYPTGDVFNHTVLADGFIYTYTNSKWTSTNIQANGSGIADGSVDYNKISPYAIELINRNGYSENMYFEGGAIDPNGKLMDNPARMRSKMLFFKAGTVFSVINFGYQINLSIYGLDKTFVSMSGYVNSYTLGIDCYVVVVIKNSAGTTLTSIPNNTLSISGDKFKSIYDSINAIKTTLNLSSPTIDYWEQGSINSDGGEAVNTARLRSSYIYLAAGTTIKMSNNYYISADYYGNNKVFVTQITYAPFIKVLQAGYYRFVVKKIDNSTITTISSNDYTIIPGSLIKKEVNKTGNYIHLSFDDVTFCIQNLITNKYTFTSIFNEPFFAKLKYFHDAYGAKFSLYCYGTTLSGLDGTFKQEFIKNSDWLKFGLHSWSNDTYTNTTAEQAKSDWDAFINSVYTVAGGLNSIDRVPRFHTFAGNLVSLQAMHDTDCGALGFLSADDDRLSYYLNSDQSNYLHTHDKFYDTANKLMFYSTDMRLDWFVTGFTSDHNYNTPIKNNPYDELVYRYNQPNMANCYSSLVIFTHEWQAYSGTYTINPTMFDMVEQVCQFANDYGYIFDYPQHRISGTY